MTAPPTSPLPRAISVPGWQHWYPGSGVNVAPLPGCFCLQQRPMCALLAGALVTARRSARCGNEDKGLNKPFPGGAATLLPETHPRPHWRHGVDLGNHARRYGIGDLTDYRLQNSCWLGRVRRSSDFFCISVCQTFRVAGQG